MSDALSAEAREIAKRHNTLFQDWSRVVTMQADRIEELEAKNARLETEAKLQAEEIDKTRRRADKWQSMVLDCEEYLKPGETPAERIQREINDCLSLMKLLEKKQRRIEELEAENARLREALTGHDIDNACMDYRHYFELLSTEEAKQVRRAAAVAFRVVMFMMMLAFSILVMKWAGWL